MLRKDNAQDQTPGSAYLREWSWEKKAALNPLYAVMSIPDFAQSSAMPSEAELRRFWADGARRVARDILPWLQQVNGFEEMRVLEFGSGMGRLLAALTGKSRSLAGVDISPSMIEHARQHLPPNVELRVLEEDGRIPFPDAEFEFVYSYAVFQHISRRSVLWRAIAEIGRVLKPGGLAKLQFTMAYPPDFATGRGAGGDSYAFENVSILWSRGFGFPFVRLRRHRHNEWDGTRAGYRQLRQALESGGLQLYGLEVNPQSGHKWFYASKYETEPQ